MIVNELASRHFSIAGDGKPRRANRVDIENLQYFDVSADAHITSLDALRVINELARRSNTGVGSGELVTATADSFRVVARNDSTQDGYRLRSSDRDPTGATRTAVSFQWNANPADRGESVAMDEIKSERSESSSPVESVDMVLSQLSLDPIEPRP